MASHLSKLCICIVTLLSLTMVSSTYDTMATDNELLSTAPSPTSPESGGEYSVSSDSSEYSPPPVPPYADALAAEIEAAQVNLFPVYPPSPAPYSTEYPSPPPSIELEVEAPAIYDHLSAPVQAPTPEPSSGFESDPLVSDTGIGSPDSEMAPHPSVLAFNYRAEDESVDFDDEYYRSEQSNNNRGAMGSLVLGAVCLVGLAGFVYKKKKKKHNKSKPEYDYELAKLERRSLIKS